MVTGARSVRPSRLVLDPIVDLIVDDLNGSVPLRDRGEVPAADRFAIEMAAIQLVRVKRTHAWLELHGDVDEDGRLRPELDTLGRCVEQASKALDRLGCSPMARARLGLDLAQTERAGREALRSHLDSAYPVDAERTEADA